mmetsp:Transcript_2461/g.7342  ORF Transcript_2461/g.7342 Transcript_2461/m.7342 type:complete len:230 (-) Transcript_2461:440-1129(-)
MSSPFSSSSSPRSVNRLRSSPLSRSSTSEASISSSRSSTSSRATISSTLSTSFFASRKSSEISDFDDFRPLFLPATPSGSSKSSNIVSSTSKSNEVPLIFSISLDFLPRRVVDLSLSDSCVSSSSREIPKISAKLSDSSMLSCAAVASASSSGSCSGSSSGSCFFRRPREAVFFVGFSSDMTLERSSLSPSSSLALDFLDLLLVDCLLGAACSSTIAASVASVMSAAAI